MPEPSVARQLLLPELRLLKTRRGARGGLDLVVEKTSQHEVCPRCASPSTSVYDRRRVTIRDEPVRRAEFRLIILKRRFSCRPCRRPFTEPVDGIRKGYRTTQRYRQAVWDAAEEFVDLKIVRTRMRTRPVWFSASSTSISNFADALGSANVILKLESTSTSFAGTSPWTGESLLA